MIDLLHTNYTKHVVPRPEAIDAAEQIFGRFQYIPHAEQLARLSLRVATGQSGAYLLDEDRRDLVRNHFLGNMHDSCAKTLTTSGIIAVNMVYAEVHDGDLSFELREPFREMPILDLVHTLHRKRQLDLL